MDVIVIAVFVSAGVVLWILQTFFWWILAIVTVHFFLFCNVFRIARPLELIWAAIFVVNICLWAWLDHLTWQHILLCQLPFTVILIVRDIFSPLYHGIFAIRVNPRLNQYLEENSAARSDSRSRESISI